MVWVTLRPPSCLYRARLNCFFYVFLPDQNKNREIKVSPVVVAKFLESELKSKDVKHCATCLCASKHMFEGMQTSFHAGTQTEMSTLHCLRCNSNLNSPSHDNSPYLIKLKSSDSVISETKSSVSDFTNHNDNKAFTPSKKDDLMVNPILGHHRLCEHTKTFNYQSFLPNDNEVVKVKDAKPSPCIESTVEREKQNESKFNVDEKSKSALTHGPGNGSTSSIWSKTSSKEGAKIFESFNRNLIKTMRVSGVRNRSDIPTNLMFN